MRAPCMQAEHNVLVLYICTGLCLCTQIIPSYVYDDFIFQRLQNLCNTKSAELEVSNNHYLRSYD